MTYIYSLVILCVGYYTFTYAISLWRDENNILGSFGAGLISIIGTIVPIVVLFIKK